MFIKIIFFNTYLSNLQEQLSCKDTFDHQSGKDEVNDALVPGSKEIPMVGLK